MLLSGERIDQLYAEDVKIIQSKEVFSFSLDAVLLANFPRLPKKGRIVDLCAGNGAVGLFISKKTKAPIIQIELQSRLADMGKRSIQLNHLEQQLTMHTLDLKNATSVIKKDSVDLVVCNPPYFKEQTMSQKNPNIHLAIARHEIYTTLEEVIHVSSQLLKTNGRLAMVHRPNRFLDLLNIFEKENIIPKRVQFIYPKQDSEANTLLIEGIKQGKKAGFRILPPLILHNEQNDYEKPIRKMLYG